MRLAHWGELVEPRELDLAADDHAAARAQLLKRGGERLAQFWVRHADKLGGGLRRVEQRAEEIENGAHATGRAELARGGDVLERRVIERGEEERELVFLQPVGCLVGT